MVQCGLVNRMVTKRMVVLAVVGLGVPFLAGCDLLGKLVQPEVRTTNVQINAGLPTFQFLNPGDSTWQTVPAVALSGELVFKDMYGAVMASGELNPNGLSTVKTRVGGQTLFGVVRSNQVIAEARQEVQASEGGAVVTLPFFATINRVVFPPTRTQVHPGETLDLPYWVFGPVYRVVGVGAYITNVSLKGPGDVVAKDGNTVRVSVDPNAEVGKTITVFLTIQGKSAINSAMVHTELVLTVAGK